MQNFCMNSDTSMSFIDKRFLAKKKSNQIVHKIVFSIKIREIGFKIHDSSEYVMVELYIPEKSKKTPAIAQLNIELHIVENLKVNVFIKMNVMKSKCIIMNFEKKFLTISICQNMEVSLTIKRKGISINKTVRTVNQMMISLEKIMTMSMRMRDADFSKNRNYNFFFKIERQLNPEKRFFAHVTNSEIIAIQVRNTSEKPYMMPKNLKIDHVRDYDEKGCFMTTPDVTVAHRDI